MDSRVERWSRSRATANLRGVVRAGAAGNRPQQQLYELALPLREASCDACLNIVTLEHVREPARVIADPDITNHRGVVCGNPTLHIEAVRILQAEARG